METSHCPIPRPQGARWLLLSVPDPLNKGFKDLKVSPESLLSMARTKDSL